MSHQADERGASEGARRYAQEKMLHCGIAAENRLVYVIRTGAVSLAQFSRERAYGPEDGLLFQCQAFCIALGMLDGGRLENVTIRRIALNDTSLVPVFIRLARRNRRILPVRPSFATF